MALADRFSPLTVAATEGAKGLWAGGVSECGQNVGRPVVQGNTTWTLRRLDLF